MSNLIQLPTKDSQIEKLQKAMEYHRWFMQYHQRKLNQYGKELAKHFQYMEIDS